MESLATEGQGLGLFSNTMESTKIIVSRISGHFILKHYKRKPIMIVHYLIIEEKGFGLVLE